MQYINKNGSKQVDEKFQEIIKLAGERAANIYDARGYCCSESVIWTINGAFGGGLDPDLAVQLGSAFCHGMGGAGCSCGSLSGSEVAISLFLGWREEGGLKKKKFEKVAKEMHDRFKERFHVTCCRVLLKRRKTKNGATCKELTLGGAEIAAELILLNRPELADTIDFDFLQARESKAGNLARKLFKKG